VAEKSRVVGFRVIVGRCESCPCASRRFARAGSSAESPPAPHPVNSGKQRTVSRRASDLKQHELDAEHRLDFRRHTNSVGETMLVPETAVGVAQDSALAGVMLTLETEITATGLSNQYASMNASNKCFDLSGLREFSV